MRLDRTRDEDRAWRPAQHAIRLLTQDRSLAHRSEVLPPGNDRPEASPHMRAPQRSRNATPRQILARDRWQRMDRMIIISFLPVCAFGQHHKLATFVPIEATIELFSLGAHSGDHSFCCADDGCELLPTFWGTLRCSATVPPPSATRDLSACIRHLSCSEGSSDSEKLMP